MYDVIYRFVELIQREWLDGGYPFSLRHNHVTSAPEKEKAPTFLLFLDAVWQVEYIEPCSIDTLTLSTLQVMQQFPLSFEFNERFLHTLFTHSYYSIYGMVPFPSFMFPDFQSPFHHCR